LIFSSSKKTGTFFQTKIKVLFLQKEKSNFFFFSEIYLIYKVKLLLLKHSSKSGKSCGLAVEYSAHDRKVEGCGFNPRPMLDGNGIKDMSG